MSNLALLRVEPVVDLDFGWLHDAREVLKVIIACFFGLSMLRTSNSVLIPICVFFIIGIALAFIFVTMLSIQQEEVNDCYKLSELQNKIKSEQEA